MLLVMLIGYTILPVPLSLDIRGWEEHQAYHTVYPFFAGLLLSRAAKPARIKNAFLWCGLLVAIVLYMTRIRGAEHV